MNNSPARSKWTSFTSYTLVTIGSVVGLSNFFQFPFFVTQYGGLFFFFFVTCLFLISLPMLFAELLIGRRGAQDPIGSIGLLSLESDVNFKWRKLGWLSFIVVFLTLSYYIVAAAFPLGYFLESLNNFIAHHGLSETKLFSEINILDSFLELEVCFLIFLILAMAVIFRGINKGLETISSITVPAYFVILLMLVGYVATYGNFTESFINLISINTSAPVQEVFLSALALALLNYNVGMGIMIVYGSYLPYHVPLNKTTFIIVIVDILISLMAYFIIYPLLLVSNPDGLTTSLSNFNIIEVFYAVPNGLFIACFFFFAAVLAGWTPIIAMLETAVVTLIERLRITRLLACLLAGAGVFILGSIEVGFYVKSINLFEIDNYEVHNFVKFLTMDVLAPISALMMAFFVGWVINKDISKQELNFKPMLYNFWIFLVRFVVPLGVLIVFITVTLMEKMPF
ncbi:sodium-dependent transporter [Gammaproteobacteria bacterium]|nr:sodium-dependent transporter [Gammaproteobacteria bacterium]